MIRHKEFVHMKYVDKKGFMSIPQKQERKQSINLIQLSNMLEKMIDEKKAQFENQVPLVDLEALGFSKLLGGGTISRAVRVKVTECSESALKKIKDAGGEAILSKAT